MTNDKVGVPVTLRVAGSKIYVVCFDLVRTHFREPFFIDSLGRHFSVVKTQIKPPEEDELLTRPIHYNERDGRVAHIPIDDFIKKYSKVNVERKLGFIFHMSRCGSTLMSQMFASSNRFFVLSEPTIINAVLDPALNIKKEKRNQLLQASINALVECSPAVSERTFIKFRSWNVLYVSRIRKIFPSVRWVFIHRHGLEVLQSVLEKQPGWLRSRKTYTKYFAPILGMSEEELHKIKQDEYVARVLGIFCKTIRGVFPGEGLCIDYKDIRGRFLSVANQLWNVSLNREEVNKVDKVGLIYSKDLSKNKRFEPDSKVKRLKSTETQRQLVDKFVEPERDNLATLYGTLSL